MKKRSTSWMQPVAAEAENRFAKHSVQLTIGGEPTCIPNEPDGQEWSFAALGPTKLDYARKFVDHLLQTRMKGGAAVFSPGKLYPGEVNPRWAINVIVNRDGSPFLDVPAKPRHTKPELLDRFRLALVEELAVRDYWLSLRETNGGDHPAWVLPLDHREDHWFSEKWIFDERDHELVAAEGPAGLRLPLNKLPEETVRRALTLQIEEGELAIFLPPLTQEGFLSLLQAIQKVAQAVAPGPLRLQGTVPSDEEGLWTIAKAAADPGVLEINLPPCSSWKEYDNWMSEVNLCAGAAGMKTWKYKSGDFPEGTGGGNHLLWGGPSLDENPFFTRPAWLARIISYFQRHPSLAYAFTGCYVGASSQAPRADESARDLYDLEMAYRFLEELESGDQRGIINETLKHLHNDITGNAHRAEISFDKFWNPGWPSGCIGLIEFRAIESLPRPEASSAVALLWHAIAAMLLDRTERLPLHPFRRSLHDRYFLPSFIRQDLAEILEELRADGFMFDDQIYRDCLDWRFPTLLDACIGEDKLVVRRAHEGWPLLSETPVEGGATSRFVDTSIRRLELAAEGNFPENHAVFVNGREVPLQKIDGIGWIAGLRYRHSRLHPSLHPGIDVQLPLSLVIAERDTRKPCLGFELASTRATFRKIRKPTLPETPLPPCKTHQESEITYDLRL